jgi:PAS domain S-box-containing protein
MSVKRRGDPTPRAGSRGAADLAARAIRALRRAIADVQAEGGTPDRVNRKRAHELLIRLADVPVAMLVANNRGRYVDANAAAVVLTGYTRAELLRSSVWDLTPPARHGAGKALWRAFLSRQRMSGRYPLRRKSGRIVEARYVAIADVLPGLHVSALATDALVRRFRQSRIARGAKS